MIGLCKAIRDYRSEKLAHFRSFAEMCVRAAAREDLSSLECRVLHGYLEGRTYQEMAGALQRAAKTIDNALQRAKRKVSARLVERN